MPHFRTYQASVGCAGAVTGIANLVCAARWKPCAKASVRRELCGAKCASYRANGTTAEQGIASQALANSRELCVKSASAKPVEQQWKTCGSRQKLARRGIYLIAAPKNAERVGVYTALLAFRAVLTGPFLFGPYRSLGSDSCSTRFER